MDSEIKTWLFDILQAITEIESYFEDKPKKFDEYVKDIRTKRAIERDMEIIGEAITGVFRRTKKLNWIMFGKSLGLATVLHMDMIKSQMI
jgi:uncharacterized protein with HEPN domain